MVRGTFNYLTDSFEGQVMYTQQPERSLLRTQGHEFDVHDMRSAVVQPSLDEEGFMAARLPLRLSGGESVERIAEIYLPMLSEFLQELTGVSKIVLRRPILRWSRRDETAGQYDRAPANYVHGDFSREVFRTMAREALAGDPDCDALLSQRYAVIQTWRVLTPPPQDFPLALLDRRTVSRDELVDLRTVIGGPGEEQEFWNFSLRHNPAHSWHYLSDMTDQDVLVFIGSESTNDIPGILHSSFDNAGNLANTVPRISCEVRAFVYWG